MIVGPAPTDRMRVPVIHGVPAFDRMMRLALSATERRSGLSILLFHRVLEVADPYRPGDPTSGQFEAIISMLARNFAVLPLEEGIERLEGGALPKAAVSITFDDGYRDNLDIAAPILVAHGLSATFYIATGFLDGDWMWNDRIIEACKRTTRRSAGISDLGLAALDLSDEARRVSAAHALIDKVKHLPPLRRSAIVSRLVDDLGVEIGSGPMLDPTSVRRLRSAGMTIGAHTVSHPILAQLDEKQARTEINDSRAHLVELLGEPVRLFAYPNGRPGRDYRTEHARMAAEAGFESAVCTTPATARSGVDRYELPRFTPWDKTPWRFAARLAMSRMSAG